MDLAPDHARRIESLIRLGTVAAVDYLRALCRVKSGDLTTDWLPWLTPRAGLTRTWDPPTIGEQVLVLSPSGEPANGIVLPGIYSTVFGPPSHLPVEDLRRYPDGATVSYNTATGVLEARGVRTALVQASIACMLDTPLTTITGNLDVRGSAMIGDGAVIEGPVTQIGGPLSSNGIVLDTHVHGGVRSGASLTAPPV
jgi:phage baseplate assembly protein V